MSNEFWLALSLVGLICFISFVIGEKSLTLKMWFGGLALCYCGVFLAELRHFLKP